MFGWARRGLLSGGFLLSAALPGGCARPDSESGRAVAAVRTVVDAAKAQVGVTVFYDPAYAAIAYPGGDIPLDRGVCADVVVRALRRAGVDLQVEVHRDMLRAFRAYPQAWGLTRPDPNIDHRRVLNLMTWFQRAGKSLPATTRAEDYRAGDIVAWRLDCGLPHIGIVSDLRSASDGRPLVVHNIGAGAQIEDVLFSWELRGHYRSFM